MLAKKFGFGFGIAVLLPMLIHYGVSTFSPQPKWNDYYNNSYYTDYKDATDDEKKELQKERNIKNKEYKSKRKVFERKLFFVATPAGIAAIVVGSFLGVQAVGAGLIFGGIFTLIDGYCWYWSELDDWMRFASLLIAFIVMIGIGYTRLNDKEKSKKTVE